MKILMIVPTLTGRGGAERVVSVLSTWLARRHAVTVAAFQTRPPVYAFGGTVVSLGFPARPGAWKAFHAMARVGAIARLIRRVQPDQVWAFMESANFPTLVAALLLGELDRVSVCVQNNPAHFPPVYRPLMRALYPRAARVVAVSKGVRAALVTEVGLEPERCVTIPNTIDVAAIDQALASSAPPRLPADSFLVAVGRLVPQKGFDLLIDAYRSLPGTAPPLVILGEGPERPALEAQVRRLGLEGRIVLPGVVDNPYAYLARAVCFVLSSRHEGWPLVLMEAMACRCPVVAFDCPYGPAEILEPGESGILVPPMDVEALAAALARVIGDPALRARLAQGGRSRVEALGVERVAESWLRGAEG